MMTGWSWRKMNRTSNTPVNNKTAARAVQKGYSVLNSLSAGEMFSDRQRGQELSPIPLLLFAHYIKIRLERQTKQDSMV